METKLKYAQYPIEERFRNFIFCKNGDIWAAYYLERTYFPLNDNEFFIPYVNDGKDMLSHDEYEYHLLNVPTQFLLDEHFKTIKEELVHGELASIGHYYYEEASKILTSELHTSKYSTFVLVKLNTIETPVTPKEYYKLFKEQLGNKFREVATGRPATTLVAPSFFIDKEEALFNDMMSYKAIRRVTEEELSKVEYYLFHRTKKILPTSIHEKEINEGIINMDSKGYITVENLETTSYTAFLPVIEMPSSLLGSGFVHEIQTSCYFPIETQIRLAFNHEQTDRKHVRKMFKRIKEQIQESDYANAELDDDEVILEGDLRLKQLNRDLKRGDRRVVRMSIYFVVSAESEDELEARIKHLQEVVKGTSYRIYRPIADQLTLFNQSLLGSRYHFKDYELHVTTGYVMDLGLDLYRTIGNEYGFPLGRGINHVGFRDLAGALLFSNQLVFFAPQLAKKNISGSLHKNGNTLIIGPSGQGKSTLIKDIFTWQVFFGQKILYIDPKNEMVEFVKRALKKYPFIRPFQELFNAINFITLSDDDAYRGVLDPLILLEGERARTQAEQTLFQLGQVNQDVSKTKYYKTIIVEAIDKVITGEESNNLSNVIEHIKQADKDLGVNLETFKNGIGKVLIGDDTSKAVDLNGHATVLGIQGLKLVTEQEKIGESLDGEQLASEAIMAINMSLVEVFSINKEEDAMVIYDEAKGFTDTTKGARLLEDSFRKGRANNTDVVALTQSHSDNDNDTMNELISYKFAFRPNSKKQQENVLRFFDMEPNSRNMTLINGLKQGTCLFQDHMGRNQPIAIDVLFEEWLEAIKTTNTEDEHTKRALELEVANQF